MNRCYINKWMKVTILHFILVTLCLAIILLPSAKEASLRITNTISGFTNSDNLLLLPAPFQTNSGAYRFERTNKGSINNFPTKSREFFARFLLAATELCLSPFYYTYLVGFLPAWFQIICQLLNIPPPSTFC